MYAARKKATLKINIKIGQKLDWKNQHSET